MSSGAYGASVFLDDESFLVSNSEPFLLGPKSMLHPAQEGIDGVKGAEVADGVDDCVREVRRQIGAGADWIKVGFLSPCGNYFEINFDME